MSEATRKFFSGRTLEQALVAAASHYEIPVDEVNYREVERRHGFVRVPRNVVIAVDPASPRREKVPRPVAPPAAPARAPRPQREDQRGGPPRERGGRRDVGEAGRMGGGRAPGRDGFRGPHREERSRWQEAAPPRTAPIQRRAERLPRAEGVEAEAAREAVARLLALAGIQAEADVFQGSGRLEIELWGPDDRLLLDDEGRLLVGMEHLIPRMMRGVGGEPLPVRVDCANFHLLREERLRDLALRVAAEVRRRGRAEILDDLDPAERRIVHTTLAGEPGVSTESLGDGYYKRLRIQPSELPE